MSAELFKIMPRTDLQNVTYRGLGSGGYADLMAGRVHVVFDNLPRSIELARSVKLRPLAVTTATRSEALPDVPVLADFVPGFDVSVWYGLGAPKNTPAEIVDTLNKEINAAFVDPRMKARFADLGGTCFPVRQPNLASSSLTKPRNGARWSERPTSRCYEAAAGSRIHRCT